MKNQRGEAIPLIIGGILMAALIVWGAFGLNSCVCTTRAKAIDLKSTWGPVQGCIVETKSGQKVDIEKFRVIE
jgi:hypothetical protein